MGEGEGQLRVVLTSATADEAPGLAHALVEERLVACATLLAGARSVYRWQGAVEEAEETLIVLKTAEEQLAALEARLVELHSYETPEFLVLEATASEGYGRWALEALRPDC